MYDEPTLVETAGDEVDVFDDHRNIAPTNMETINRFLAQLKAPRTKAGAAIRKEKGSSEVPTSIMVEDPTAAITAASTPITTLVEVSSITSDSLHN